MLMLEFVVVSFGMDSPVADHPCEKQKEKVMEGGWNDDKNRIVVQFQVSCCVTIFLIVTSTFVLLMNNDSFKLQNSLYNYVHKYYMDIYVYSFLPNFAVVQLIAHIRFWAKHSNQTYIDIASLDQTF